MRLALQSLTGTTPENMDPAYEATEQFALDYTKAAKSETNDAIIQRAAALVTQGSTVRTIITQQPLDLHFRLLENHSRLHVTNVRLEQDIVTGLPTFEGQIFTLEDCLGLSGGVFSSMKRLDQMKKNRLIRKKEDRHKRTNRRNQRQKEVMFCLHSLLISHQ